MEPRNVYTVVFSPTGTSKKIARAIAQGLAGHSPVVSVDVTHARPKAAVLPADAVVVIAAPVYGGHIAPLALERMKELHGDRTPAVVVAIYGNRDFGNAAAQLAAVAVERRFVPIAAGAFVGEHSYCSDRNPIAAGRPDVQDLAEATAFGAAVREKLGRDDFAPADAGKLLAPRTPFLSRLRFVWFALNYMRRQKRHPIVRIPVTDATACTHCGRCAALCPAGAIARGSEECTDSARCIRCNACVKACPVGARSYDTPFAAALARNFSERKEPVTIL